MTDDLAARPCGEIPEKLIVYEPEPGSLWALVKGGCCDEWTIVFDTNDTSIRSKENNRLAREAWNAVPSGKK